MKKVEFPEPVEGKLSKEQYLEIIAALNINVKLIHCDLDIVEVSINTPYGVYFHRSGLKPDSVIDMIIPYEHIDEPVEKSGEA